MNSRMILGLVALVFLGSTLLSSCCSFPYKVDVGRAPSSELAQVHVRKAEVVSIDSKMVSVKRTLLPAHLVIKKGTHEMVVNYWEKMVFSTTPQKLHFTAEPKRKYCVVCQRVRSGKAIDRKVKDARYLFTRKGNEYYQDKDGYYYSYECCLKDKETNETISCK